MTTHAHRDEGTTSRLRKPLVRFRVAAYVTGVGLLVLCAAMVVRYGFGYAAFSEVYSPIHGVLYMIYVVLTVDLAIKARWSIKGAIGVLLAGCVPLLSFVVERLVTRRTLAGETV